jgi:hypothetical protein
MRHGGLGHGPLPGRHHARGPLGALAQAYGLRDPADGATPVGDAIVDGQVRIRYRTLDPTMADELDEVDTVLGALP